jgi:hypothetical protein
MFFPINFSLNEPSSSGCRVRLLLDDEAIPMPIIIVLCENRTTRGEGTNLDSVIGCFKSLKVNMEKHKTINKSSVEMENPGRTDN